MEPDAMMGVADRALDDLDLSDHQAVIVCHNDTDHPHLHVLVNRVHPETGKAWPKWRYKTRLERSLKTQERELGIREVPGRLSRKLSLGERLKKRASGGLDINALKQWGKEKVASLRGFIRPHFDGASSWNDLEERVGEDGLRIHAKGQGLIFSDGQSYAKLSQLGGRKHRLGSLEARFGSWKDHDDHRHGHDDGFNRRHSLDRRERDDIETRLAARKRRRDRDLDNEFER